MRDGGRQIVGRPAAALTALTLGAGALGTAAVPTLAASPKPKTGCWGICGGVGLAAGGHLTLEKGEVVDFAVTDKCLGTLPPYNILAEVGLTVASPSGLKRIKLRVKDDAFSFKGDAFRDKATSTDTSRGSYAATPLEVKGRFVSSTKAVATVKIGYGRCGTKHLTILYAG